jgi:hypothetical protein
MERVPSCNFCMPWEAAGEGTITDRSLHLLSVNPQNDIRILPLLIVDLISQY